MATIATIATTDPEGRFSILVNIASFVDAELDAGLIAALSNPDAAITVFAPTNGAFTQLALDLGIGLDTPSETEVTSFLQGLGAELLASVVTYHVLGTPQTAADIARAGSVTTLQGGTIGAGDLPTLVDNEPDVIDPSLLATDIIATNGIVHVIDRVLLPADLPGNDAPTITEIALASGTGFDSNGEDFDLLREAVVAAGLADTLGDVNADFTVFAPNDAAFVGLAQSLGFGGSDEAGAFGYIVDALRLLNQGGDPIALLTQILTYHVAGESLQASQVIAQGAVETLQGGTLTLEGLSLVDADPDAVNPSLIATDIQAANGVVHVVDGVLLPVDVLPSDGSNDVDFVIGTDARNFYFTGADNDFVDAKAGHDFVFSGSGDDVVLAGRGRDYVVAGAGDDVVLGEGGNDLIKGRAGQDTINGGSGNDFIRGGSGADVILGEDGNDTLLGGRQDDTLVGGDDNDVLRGSTGNDLLEGEDGHDILRGGHGRDTLNGGTGNDLLVGGGGADLFIFEVGMDHDTVQRYQAGHDTLDLSDFELEGFETLDIQSLKRDTVIDLQNGDAIFLRGVDAHSLSADDFIF
ncbi:fasciclin domain-containing protein [Roseobacteraceae bacterium S113]